MVFPWFSIPPWYFSSEKKWRTWWSHQYFFARCTWSSIRGKIRITSTEQLVCLGSHSHGGTPRALSLVGWSPKMVGLYRKILWKWWFIIEKPTQMDDARGFFPILGNLHLGIKHGWLGNPYRLLRKVPSYLQKLRSLVRGCSFTLWLFNIAMENGP
jgi:hypothetical protein